MQKVHNMLVSGGSNILVEAGRPAGMFRGADTKSLVSARNQRAITVWGKRCFIALRLR